MCNGNCNQGRNCDCGPRADGGLVGWWMVLVIAAAMVFLLSGCGEPTPQELGARSRLYAISLGQEAVQSGLRDPGSVEWESKFINLDSNALCYIYRARNGFGGMSQGFAVILDGKIHRTNKIFDKHCQVKGGNYEIY